MNKQGILLFVFQSEFYHRGLIMRKFIIFISILTSVFVLSCSKIGSNNGSLYIPTSSDVTANATLSELQQGRQLYINNCGSCHGLSSPDDFSANSWKSIMSSMAPKTSLSPSEVTLVTKYVSRGKQ
jgi:hypothetical protein